MVNLPDNTPPGVDAIQPLRAAEHDLGSACEASRQKAPYLGAYAEGLLFREARRDCARELGLVDLLVVLALCPLKDFPQARRFRDDIALHFALPGRSSLGPVVCVVWMHHYFVVKHRSVFVRDCAQRTGHAQGHRPGCLRSSTQRANELMGIARAIVVSWWLVAWCATRLCAGRAPWLEPRVTAGGAGPDELDRVLRSIDSDK